MCSARQQTTKRPTERPLLASDAGAPSCWFLTQRERGRHNIRSLGDHYAKTDRTAFDVLAEQLNDAIDIFYAYVRDRRNKEYDRHLIGLRNMGENLRAALRQVSGQIDNLTGRSTQELIHRRLVTVNVPAAEEGRSA
jgi:hypothetical protein